MPKKHGQYSINVGRRGFGGARDGALGNPYKVGETSFNTETRVTTHFRTAGDTLPHYEKYLRLHLSQDPDFAAWFDKELPGKRLWCPGCGFDSAGCHARVIEKILKERTGK